MTHNFHIPVMGLAYTIDTPLRVASKGIDSVVSIVDDDLAEKMRAFFCKKHQLPYTSISAKSIDHRAKRITAYLNVLDRLVKEKFQNFLDELSANKKELDQFIGMLPPKSVILEKIKELSPENFLQHASLIIKDHLSPGAIDVNIMTKVDKTNFRNKVALDTIYNDAHASLRGFAQSNLKSTLILSAGMNPSLYSYIGTFSDFLPDADGQLKKKVSLKVSDFRSAMIQGNFLAKKGVWVSEYRIESGLNCGGHAFATDGLLLGPILEEFKTRRTELEESIHGVLIKALKDKGCYVPDQPLKTKITVQGGVGTSEEHNFLLDHYSTDAVGWGSPFLLVPEATAIDQQTRQLLASAKEEDLYRSELSPLGVPFNTLRGASNDFYKQMRIDKQRPGSSCPKKYLALSKEFGEEGICTASRKYQELKIKELEESKSDYTNKSLQAKRDSITVKSCLCVGLANPAYMEKEMEIKGEKQGVVICPGPNLAYFDKEISLSEMVRHIYGYTNVLKKGIRPHMFIKELQLYVDFLVDDIQNNLEGINRVKVKRWKLFKRNLMEGISYYENLFGAETTFFKDQKETVLEVLSSYKSNVNDIIIPNVN